MQTRSTDLPLETKPTRVVTLVTAISVATPFLLAGCGVVWSLLSSQIAKDAARAETDKQVIEKLGDLKVNVQVLTDRMQLKSDIDAEQSAAIKDLDRRMNRVEARQ